VRFSVRDTVRASATALAGDVAGQRDVFLRCGDGDTQAREQLIVRCVPLARHRALSFNAPSLGPHTTDATLIHDSTQAYCDMLRREGPS